MTLLKIGSIESWDSQLFKTALDEWQTILEKFSASTIFLNSHLLSQIFCIVEAENFSKIVCHSSRAVLNSWESQLSIEPILSNVNKLLALIQASPIIVFSLMFFPYNILTTQNKQIDNLNYLECWTPIDLASTNYSTGSVVYSIASVIEK